MRALIYLFNSEFQRERQKHREKYKERRRARKRIFCLVFGSYPVITATVGLGLASARSWETLVVLSERSKDPCIQAPFCCFAGHSQGGRWEIEQPDTNLGSYGLPVRLACLHHRFYYPDPEIGALFLFLPFKLVKENEINILND